MQSTCSMNCFTVLLKKRLPLNYTPPYAFPYSSSAADVLESGHILKLDRTFSESDIVGYSKLTLDSNPLHFDPKYATDAGFIDRLVPGMLVASLFPRVIASQFPGAVYVSQTLHFKNPVYIGEEISAEVQATMIRGMRNKYITKFTTKCFKEGNTLVVDGEATAILPSLRVKPE